ncbi:hypothetical protein [Autumnicola edwardsiae]|uniref:Uncharacterized protein n=1 Tax=Autumnicola edwardsiae TaxID=3075594 RepID=A0ABU3CUJ1_9FLAO|nr:hypothetical protein [Zunongwangia sp. F297]MDT0650029.1 hypothetical protein [Zunongwangia sp. F297]
MKSSLKILTCFISFGIFLCTTATNAQDQERITPPGKPSKVKSIDDFSNHCFKIYNTVFVYDSLVQTGVEIPAEIEDEIATDIEARIDSLSDIVPDMIGEVDNAPLMRKLRAAGSLNKSRKAISYMLQFTKKYTLGSGETEGENISSTEK